MLSKRPFLLSLVAAVVLLLLGLAGLLWISYTRDQHYQDEVKSLRFELTRKQDSLQRLKEQMLFPIPKRDSSTNDGWSSATPADSLLSSGQ